ncbi:hybrid sensor histidine kinase/response regulator, partial [candidate division KSB1 bacterium]
MRILIAEDDLVSRRVLQKNIEMWGHEVLVAKDGLEAWKMFIENKLQMVISDWMMPQMDGLT